MKIYARIQNGLVAELLTTDKDIRTMFHPALIWIDVTSQPDIRYGWQFDGGNFSPPVVLPSAPPLPTISDLQAQITALSAQLAALSNKT